MFHWLKKRRASTEGSSPGGDSLAGEIAQGAERFRTWVKTSHPELSPDSVAAIDQSIAQYPAGTGEALPEAFASDAASALGEILRDRFGGEWKNDALHGPVISSPSGLDHGRLIPLAAIERKALHPDGFSLEKLVDSLRERLVAEEKITPWPGGGAGGAFAPLEGLTGSPAHEAAHTMAQDFRKEWEARLGAPVALSLMGVRQVDRFLRSHYIACFLEEGDFVRAGIFLGEVGRGLFGGNWDFSHGDAPDLAPLRYPELDYYPIGRIFKMMVEKPEGEPLDEYLRLIPSARRELAGGQGQPE